MLPMRSLTWSGKYPCCVMVGTSPAQLAIVAGRKYRSTNGSNFSPAIGARQPSYEVMVGRFPMIGNPKSPLNAMGVPLAYRCTAPMRHPPMTCEATPLRSQRLPGPIRSEEHTSELQSLAYLVCRLLL